MSLIAETSLLLPFPDSYSPLLPLVKEKLSNDTAGIVMEYLPRKPRKIIFLDQVAVLCYKGPGFEEEFNHAEDEFTHALRQFRALIKNVRRTAEIGIVILERYKFHADLKYYLSLFQGYSFTKYMIGVKPIKNGIEGDERLNAQNGDVLYWLSKRPELNIQNYVMISSMINPDDNNVDVQTQIGNLFSTWHRQQAQKVLDGPMPPLSSMLNLWWFYGKNSKEDFAKELGLNVARDSDPERQ